MKVLVDVILTMGCEEISFARVHGWCAHTDTHVRAWQIFFWFSKRRRLEVCGRHSGAPPNDDVAEKCTTSVVDVLGLRPHFEALL